MSGPTLDYDRFEDFSAYTTVWTINHDLVLEFNRRYGQVLAGEPITLAEVTAPLNSIFGDFERQSESEVEEAFVTELRSLVISRLDAEFRFFRSLSDEQLQNYRNVPDQAILVRKFSFLSTTILKLICRWKAKTLHLRAQLGMNDRVELTHDHGVLSVVLRSVLGLLFRFNGVTRILKKSWGKYTGVIGVGLELSVPNASWWKPPSDLSRSAGTSYAHVDEAREFPKAIIYLNEVKAADGATEFFPEVYSRCSFSPLQQLIGRVVGNVGASPISPLYGMFRQVGPNRLTEVYREMFMRLPAELRHNSHFGWDVPSDGLFSHWVLEKCLRVTGPAGTYVVFDGARTLHRGGLATEGNRLVLQVVFGPILLSEELSKLKCFLKKFSLN
jgi:hypothetical protein